MQYDNKYDVGTYTGQLPSDAQYDGVGMTESGGRAFIFVELLAYPVQSPAVPQPGPVGPTHATQLVHCIAEHVLTFT